MIDIENIFIKCSGTGVMLYTQLFHNGAIELIEVRWKRTWLLSSTYVGLILSRENISLP